MSENYWNENYLVNAAPDNTDGWMEKYEFQPGDQVLDLGCGAGTNLPFLIGKGACVSAADLSHEAISLVSSRFGDKLVSAICFDMLEGFPYPDNSFDAVVSDLSLHYFSWADTQRIVKDLRRILQPGGRLIARVHSLRNLPETDVEKIEDGYYIAYGLPRRYFQEEELRSLFAAWQFSHLKETTARRYRRCKHVIEFMVFAP